VPDASLSRIRHGFPLPQDAMDDHYTHACTIETR
jgi:hypothetical protein